MIAGLVYGQRRLESWAYQKNSLDFYDLKGHLEDLFNSFELKNITFVSTSHPMLCPGVAAEIKLKNKKIGIIVMLNPELAADMKLDDDAFIFEIDYSSL